MARSLLSPRLARRVVRGSPVILFAPTEAAHKLLGVERHRDASAGHVDGERQGDAVLVFEVTDVLTVNKDVWSVCTVEWPSGHVIMTTDDAGGYKITPNYINPFFFAGATC